MAWRTNVLVVANVTASSEDLLGALRRLAEHRAAHFTLIVPASPFGGGRTGAAATLETALQHLREAGLEADGLVGDGDPCVAVTEAYDPRRHDQIVVSTLPLGASKWLHAGLPERIARLTDAPVTHVVSRPRATPPESVPAPPHAESLGLLGPLLAPYGALPHTEAPGTASKIAPR
jgi:hypothetical protein